MNIKRALTIGLLSIATIGLVGCAITFSKKKVEQTNAENTNFTTISYNPTYNTIYYVYNDPFNNPTQYGITTTPPNQIVEGTIIQTYEEDDDTGTKPKIYTKIKINAIKQLLNPTQYRLATNTNPNTEYELNNFLYDNQNLEKIKQIEIYLTSITSTHTLNFKTKYTLANNTEYTSTKSITISTIALNNTNNEIKVYEYSNPPYYEIANILRTTYRQNYNAGTNAGYETGYEEGQTSTESYQNGYENGYNDGVDIAYQTGYEQALQQKYNINTQFNITNYYTRNNQKYYTIESNIEGYLTFSHTNQNTYIQLTGNISITYGNNQTTGFDYIQITTNITNFTDSNKNVTITNFTENTNTTTFQGTTPTRYNITPTNFYIEDNTFKLTIKTYVDNGIELSTTNTSTDNPTSAYQQFTWNCKQTTNDLKVENFINQIAEQTTNAYDNGYLEGTRIGGTEIIDIRGIILTIITMPFTFITQAFDVTLWEGTQYAFHVGAFIKAMIAIASILFIIKLFTSGFSIMGNYTGNIDDKLGRRQERKARINKMKAETRRTDKLADKGK